MNWTMKSIKNGYPKIMPTDKLIHDAGEKKGHHTLRFEQPIRKESQATLTLESTDSKEMFSWQDKDVLYKLWKLR